MGKEGEETGVVQEVLELMPDMPGRLSVETAEERRGDVRAEIRKYDLKIESAREKLEKKFPQREKVKTLQKELDTAKEERRLIKARGGEENRSEADRKRFPDLEEEIAALDLAIEDNTLTEKDLKEIATEEVAIEELHGPWLWLIRQDNALRDYIKTKDALENLDEGSDDHTKELKELAENFREMAGVTKKLVEGAENAIGGMASATEERKYDKRVERYEELEPEIAELKEQVADVVEYKAWVRR